MPDWRLSFVALFAALAAGCAPAPTQLVVVVDTDLAIPSALDEVRVQVTGPGGMAETETTRLGSRAALPLSLGVAPSGTELGPIDVIATGYRDGEHVVDRSATVTLVAGETRVLSLFLLSNCVGVTCPEGETCGEGGSCEEREIEPPPWTGVLPSIDGGMMDAPIDAPGADVPGADVPGLDAPDAGTPDAGPPCSSDGECDDGIACTDDSCEATGCQHTPNDGMCEDGNPCTDGTCGAGGCVQANNAAPCDDGVYCNGVDVCSAGTCQHPGDPCTSPTVCDEAADACVGCTTRAQCPADVVGAWTSCDYADGCDESARRSRTDVTYACVSGSCVATPMNVTEPCSRDTDGTGCGTGSCGGYGACDWSSSCDESAVQSRTCTDLVCTAGTCTGRPRTETMPCSRDTDGTGCGSSCGSWGTCSYGSVCATSGTQSRSCTDSTCSAGSCVAGMPRTEMQSCGMRSTNGTDCGTTCGAWGSCTYASECDEDATRSRSCTPRTCSGGSCATGMPMTEFEGCTRSTEGNSCSPDTCSPGYGTCNGGACSGFSGCVGSCICDNAEPFGNCYDPTPPYEFCPIA